ncbi:MAG: aspartate ammonia-lyase, partial [Tidjanibacter sp.]|nr:aspartate ammonia-lyase [Tidjanibacter sp.]
MNDITKCALSGATRSEHDLLGDKEIPVEYYFGVQTMRAVENFHISRVKLCMYPEFIKALAEVKAAAAMANRDLGLMDTEVAEAIIAACKEVAEGKLDSHFVVDMVQGGAG